MRGCARAELDLTQRLSKGCAIARRRNDRCSIRFGKGLKDPERQRSANRDDAAHAMVAGLRPPGGGNAYLHRMFKMRAAAVAAAASAGASGGVAAVAAVASPAPAVV